jgi:hypothetical protein
MWPYCISGLQALSMHPTAGPKQASQEQLSAEKEGLTYGQIRLIIACKQHGIDWNTFIVQNPPLQPSLKHDNDIDESIPF